MRLDEELVVVVVIAATHVSIADELFKDILIKCYCFNVSCFVDI